MSDRVLSFIGGTGPEGLGLAIRFAHAGYPIIIGSRKQERADEAARTVLEAVPGGNVRGMENEAAVGVGGVIFITIPYNGQRPTLESLHEVIGDKIVINTVVPLAFEKGKPVRYMDLEDNSAAEESQKLAPNARVAGAFQNLSAPALMDLSETVSADVIVCSDDAEAKAMAMELSEKIEGVRGVDGGALENSRYVESITALLLNINRRYKGAHSMVKISGV